MTNPTQNQNKNPQAGSQNQNPQAGNQNRQDQAQGRKDDMHNTGAQAKTSQAQTASKDADKDMQQRKEAPKQDQNH
jgi:hypothetical protein